MFGKFERLYRIFKRPFIIEQILVEIVAYVTLQFDCLSTF